MDDNQTKNRRELFYSVVIPVYNAEKYLAETVSSILNQTYKNFELILVDDGSKDSSSQMCDEYSAKDARVRVIHQSNGGVTRARKRGVSEANGEYTLCIDQDDLLMPNALECISELILKEDCQPDVILFGFVQFGMTTEVSLLPSVDEGCYCIRNVSEEIVSKLCGGSFWSRAYRTEFLNTQLGLFNDSIMVGEDSTFNAVCMRYAEYVIVTHQCLHRYRSHQESNQRKWRNIGWEQPILLHDYMYATTVKDFPNTKSSADRIFIAITALVAATHFYDNNYFAAASEIKKRISMPDYQKLLSSCEKLGGQDGIKQYALNHKNMLMLWIFALLRKWSYKNRAK